MSLEYFNICSFDYTGPNGNNDEINRKNAQTDYISMHFKTLRLILILIFLPISMKLLF